jgi:hypothetical protein
MERVIKGITDAHGGSYEFKYEYGYRPVINDAETRKKESCIRTTIRVLPSMKMRWKSVSRCSLMPPEK